jgi:hypothetical protein
VLLCDDGSRNDGVYGYQIINYFETKEESNESKKKMCMKKNQERDNWSDSYAI